MTRLLYLVDSYKKNLKSKVVSLKPKGNHFELILTQTIFYPEGGGQPSDRGEISGKSGKFRVTHVRLSGDDAVHEGKLTGKITVGQDVELQIDWQNRYKNMQTHSAGHILHEVAMQTVPGLLPLHGNHGKHAYIEYQGKINPKLRETLQKQMNMLIAAGKDIRTQMISLNELKKLNILIPHNLPKNKPLRIIQIDDYPPTPDGGTQVKNTTEAGSVKIDQIEQSGDRVRIYYEVIKEKTNKKQSTAIQSYEQQNLKKTISKTSPKESTMTLNNFRILIFELQSELLDLISRASSSQLEPLKIRYFGSHGIATELIRRLKELPMNDRKNAGMLINGFKSAADAAFADQTEKKKTVEPDWFDVTLPAILPPQGHLHIVTQAIMEITRIFERIGFIRVRYPEVDWDWYAFEALNMPPQHPARDEWETFFIETPHSNPLFTKERERVRSKNRNMVLTPHTSNGQVREMEKGKFPIRMINIAKNYRRQSDISHVPMLHQFEGLYVDHNVSIAHLKGVLDYFVKHFFGAQRKTRIRPFHFQFTEPSFEVDISCGICSGKGCKLCKEGWLEIGGAGMVHPQVLRNGGVDPDIYNGFAFGWGVERCYMMKPGTQIDDIRLLYSNDLRFLEQF